MKQEVTLCLPCEKAAKENASVTLRCIRRGSEEKITCDICGRRRYGGLFEFVVEKK